METKAWSCAVASIIAVALLVACNNTVGTPTAADREARIVIENDPVWSETVDGMTADPLGVSDAASGGTWNHSGSAARTWRASPNARTTVLATDVAARLSDALARAGWLRNRCRAASPTFVKLTSMSHGFALAEANVVVNADGGVMVAVDYRGFDGTPTSVPCPGRTTTAVSSVQETSIP